VQKSGISPRRGIAAAREQSARLAGQSCRSVPCSAKLLSEEAGRSEALALLDPLDRNFTEGGQSPRQPLHGSFQQLLIARNPPGVFTRQAALDFEDCGTLCQGIVGLDFTFLAVPPV
jgi:hypothetical protein